MKVFIDINLLLDVLAERKPFYETAARIWELVEKRELKPKVRSMGYRS